jgi:hypothetical protein
VLQQDFEELATTLSSYVVVHKDNKNFKAFLKALFKVMLLMILVNRECQGDAPDGASRDGLMHTWEPEVSTRG